jgi:hypothetical protein
MDAHPDCLADKDDYTNCNHDLYGDSDFYQNKLSASKHFYFYKYSHRHIHEDCYRHLYKYTFAYLDCYRHFNKDCVRHLYTDAVAY